MATQPTLGFPADSLGADGDAAQDLKNRIIYYPKANGTWANATAYAFQGQVGPAPLAFPGTPPDSAGSPGQGAIDFSTGLTYIKSAQNTWGNSTGRILGAQGIAGPSGQSVPSMNSTSYAFAPTAANQTALALSGTPQSLPVNGSTQPWYFIPSVATTFAGGTFVLSSANNPGSVTFNLVDQTAGQTKWSFTISQFGTVSVQTANVPLTTGNTHTWLVSGSGNAFAQASATLLQPASVGISTPYGQAMTGTFANAPTSAQAIPIGSASNVAQYISMPKTGFLYSAQFVWTGGSSATFGLYNAAGTLIYQTSVSNNQNTPVLVGPFAVNQYTVTATYYTWRVTSSASGYASVIPQFCF